jgi:hypothetical protein
MQTPFNLLDLSCPPFNLLSCFSLNLLDLQEYGFWFREEATRALAIHLNRHIVVVKGGKKGFERQETLYIFPMSTGKWHFEGRSPRPDLLCLPFSIQTRDGEICLPSICFEPDTIVILHNSSASEQFHGSHFWKTSLMDAGAAFQSDMDFLADKRRECETSGIIIRKIILS